MDRLRWFRQAGITFDGRRDTYQILGYQRLLANRDYRARYLRGGVAGRIVDALPNATWRGSMELIEDEKPKTDTAFEKAWKELDTRLQIQAKLSRVDKLSRLSTYAVLLIGAPGELETELPRGGPNQLLYLTPFIGGGGPLNSMRITPLSDDADCVIQSFETDAKNARFGQPATYQIKRTDFSSPDFLRPVHWTRIIHIAENVLEDEVYGQPALERVWNLLDDLEKVTGGGAEAFWLRANAGLHLDVDKDLMVKDKPGEPSELDKLKQQAEDYSNQMVRMMRTRGVSVNQLGSDVANFSSPADAILTQIAGATTMPKRILTGSEMGELASSQDRDNWKDQVNGRQTGYAGPYIVRRLVARLIEYGYLPTPAGGERAYEVRWPHIQTLTDQEKAEGAAKWASVNQTFGVTVFTEEEIRDHWYQMEPADEGDDEIYKAELAIKMATVNKTQGIVVFTPKEIRKTCYGWAPLPPSEEVPVGAPERISVKQAPTEPGQKTPATVSAPVTPFAKRAAEALNYTLRALEDAIERDDLETIGDLLTLGGPGSGWTAEGGHVPGSQGGGGLTTDYPQSAAFAHDRLGLAHDALAPHIGAPQTKGSSLAAIPTTKEHQATHEAFAKDRIGLAQRSIARMEELKPGSTKEISSHVDKALKAVKSSDLKGAVGSLKLARATLRSHVPKSYLTLQERKFSSTQIQIPREQAALLFQIGDLVLDGDLNLAEGGRENDAHVTVKYGLHTDDFRDVAAVVKGRGAVTFTFGKTNFFSTTNYDVLYVDVKSEALVRLNNLIATNLEVTDTHPTYQPHATIAYLKPGRGEMYKGLGLLDGVVAYADILVFSNTQDVKTEISLG